MTSGHPQQWEFVLYHDPRGGNLLWHHRRILGEVVLLDGTRSRIFAVLAPDNDVYLEDYSGEDVAILVVRFAGAQSTLPLGIPRAVVYKFKRATPAGQLEASRTLGVAGRRDRWCHRD